MKGTDESAELWRHPIYPIFRQWEFSITTDHLGEAFIRYSTQMLIHYEANLVYSKMTLFRLKNNIDHQLGFSACRGNSIT